MLIVMFVIIAVLIYILAGGSLPSVGRVGGVQSPTMPATSQITTGVTASGEFTDGLTNPDFSEQYQLDEFGAGVAARDIFDRDVDGDGRRLSAIHDLVLPAAAQTQHGQEKDSRYRN